MAPKAKRREVQHATTSSNRMPGNVSQTSAPRGRAATDAAPAVTSLLGLTSEAPRGNSPRILVLRKKKPSERIAEIAAAVPLVEQEPNEKRTGDDAGSCTTPTATTVVRGRTAGPLLQRGPHNTKDRTHDGGVSDAERVMHAAVMLRAVYVVSHTEKAQLKLRPHDLGSSMSSHYHHPSSSAAAPNNTSNSTRYNGALATAASPQKVMPTGLGGGGLGAFRSLPTPPPSPSRFFGYLTSAMDAASPPRSQQMTQRDGETTSSSPIGSSEPPTAVLSIVVFADQRWRSAVSSFIGGEPFTLDHLARLPQLFPDHIRVAWTCGGTSAGASSASLAAPLAGSPMLPPLLGSGRHIEDALRQLAEEQGGGAPGDWSATGMRPLFASSGDAAYGAGGGSLRARVTLLKVDVPSTDTLVADLMGRNGVDLTRSLEFETAWSLLVKRNTLDGQTPVAVTRLQPPSPPAMSTEGEQLPATRKRDRDDDPAALAAVHAAAIPEHLLAVLSHAKRDSIVQAASTQHKAEINREAESLSLRHSLEKLLSVYDLMRICFGVGRTQIGGAKLLEVLTDQNRYGCSRDEIAAQVRRLLTFPESGLSTASLDGDAMDHADAEATPTTPSSVYEGQLFRLNPSACRASLEAAIAKRALQPIALSATSL